MECIVGLKRRAYSSVIEPQTEFIVWASTAGSATVTIFSEQGESLQSFESRIGHRLEPGSLRLFCR